MKYLFAESKEILKYGDWKPEISRKLMQIHLAPPEHCLIGTVYLAGGLKLP
jgi:hypothetical protein